MSVQADIIHDFVKSDDEPPDILGPEESFARALAATSSAPNGPVDLCYDFDIQEADPGGIRPARKRQYSAGEVMTNPFYSYSAISERPVVPLPTASESRSGSV